MTRYLAHAALLGAALIYSLFNLVAAHTLLHVDPLTFSTAREGGAALLLYIWAAKAESPLRVPSSRADRRLFLLLGVLLASFQLCFMLGIALTSAVTAALLQCVEPCWLEDGVAIFRVCTKLDVAVAEVYPHSLPN